MTVNPSIKPSINLSVSVGHLPPPCGVWHCNADRGDHRESILPGERRPAEQVQGAGSREALCGGNGLDPGQGRGHTGDQSLGT